MKLFLGREQTKLLHTVYTREMIVILKRTVTYPGWTACRLILFSWSIGSTVDLQTEIFLLLFDFRELGISSAPKDPGTSLWSPPGAVLTSSSSVSFRVSSSHIPWANTLALYLSLYVKNCLVCSGLTLRNAGSFLMQ